MIHTLSKVFFTGFKRAGLAGSSAAAVLSVSWVKPMIPESIREDIRAALRNEVDIFCSFILLVFKVINYWVPRFLSSRKLSVCLWVMGYTQTSHH